MEDINYLLFLETLKRFKDDSTNLTNQVDSKTRQYLDVKAEYQYWYAKYISLVKLAATRASLEQNIRKTNSLCDNQIEKVANDVTESIKKLTTHSSVAYLTFEDLEKCKEKLQAYEELKNLKSLQKDLADNKTAVKAIQKAADTTETTIETATNRALDYFIEEVDEHNFDINKN